MSDMSMLPRDIRIVLVGPMKHTNKTVGLRYLDGMTHKEYAARIQVRYDIRCDWQDVDIVYESDPRFFPQEDVGP